MLLTYVPMLTYLRYLEKWFSKELINILEEQHLNLLRFNQEGLKSNTDLQ